MTRITILVAVVALATGACTGSAAPASTEATPDTTTPAAATQAPVTTPAPTATRRPEATAEMTWDGANCTYAGPTAVPRGTRLTVTVTNTPESTTNGRDGAAFFLVRIDDGITKVDFDAWLAEHPKGSDYPSWVHANTARVVYAYEVPDGLQLEATLWASRYSVTCGESPKDGEEMHFGAIIEVKDS